MADDKKTDDQNRFDKYNCLARVAQETLGNRPVKSFLTATGLEMKRESPNGDKTVIFDAVDTYNQSVTRTEKGDDGKLKTGTVSTSATSGDPDMVKKASKLLNTYMDKSARCDAPKF